MHKLLYMNMSVVLMTPKKKEVKVNIELTNCKLDSEGVVSCKVKGDKVMEDIAKIRPKKIEFELVDEE